MGWKEVEIMDTSETYIKMCDCPEIQGGKGVLLATAGKRIQCSGNDVYADVDTLTTTWHTVWLPRQDQIQKMMPFNSTFSAFGWLTNLNYWIELNRKYAYQFNSSFEQLWLAFYMWEKHEKKWDGEKWK